MQNRKKQKSTNKFKTIGKRVLALMLLQALLFSFLPMAVFAVDPPPSPPRNLVVDENSYRDEGIGKSWYARFKWTAPTYPAGAVSPTQSFFFEKVEKTGTLTQARQVDLPSTTTQMDSAIDISPELETGTIYNVYGTASYKYGDMGQFTATSSRSASTRFLTGLKVNASRVSGTNDIRVTWDDVWDIDGRINYQLLISETRGFSQPPNIPIIQGKDIGTPGSPITVNVTTGKLEYIWTGASAGREYVIKVVPLPPTGVSVVKPADIPTTPPVQTGILLFAQKVGYTEDAVIWKFFWDPIASDLFSRVEYSLFRKTDNDSATELNMATIPNTNSYYLTVPKTDTHLYSFKVEATATMKDDPNQKVFFLSDAYVELKETIPEKPESPLYSDFPGANPPLFFEDLLKPTEATLLFLAPRNGLGQVDSDITYDIYMTQKVDEVLNPQPSTRIATRVAMTAANEIKDANTGVVIGYKYTISGLLPNETYYVSIAANKQYLLPDENGNYVTTLFSSEPSAKVIITQSDAGTTRPVAPPAPPFGVFRNAAGVPAITLDGVTLRMEKKWYQLYTPSTVDGIIGRWDRVEKAVYDTNDLLAAGHLDKKPGQIVNYQAGWQLVPHAIPYADVLERVKYLYPLRGGAYVTYSDLKQPFMTALEKLQPVQPKAVIPAIPVDQADQSFTFPIQGLEENTAYLVWITVENTQGNLSDPSDPLVVTTHPVNPEVVTVPVVPMFQSVLAGDSFVDLTWQTAPGMDYEIAYGTSEDRTKAIKTVKVHEADYTARGFYRLEDLTPETRYNLWIRAMNTAMNATGSAIGLASGWSGAFPIKTEAWQPPATPTGFGVKEGDEGITANSITYEWVPLPDLTYQLEFSENALFKNAQKIVVSDGSHTVPNLISNRRYYARLYAVSPKSKLLSEPTRTVVVVTDRSRKDYDSSYDLDDLPAGDTLLYGQVGTDGVWTTKSVGVQAYRLAESIRALGEPVVQIDLSNPPAGVKVVRLELGSAVYDTLAALKMDLRVQTPSSDWVVRPGSFQTDSYFKTRTAAPDMTVRMDVRTPASEYKQTAGMAFKTPVTEIKVSTGIGDRYTGLTDFVRPLQASIPVSGLAGYMRDEIGVQKWSTPGVWTKLASQVDYDAGSVLADVATSAPIVAAIRSVPTATSVPNYVKTSLTNIGKRYPLPALSGVNWKATDTVSPEMLSKLLLDVVPYDWTKGDPLTTAVRAGFIRTADANSTNIRREQTVYAVVALYAKKSGEKPLASPAAVSYRDFTDWNGVDSVYLNSMRFAVENGLIQGNGSGKLNPNATITVGEVLVLIERALTIAGDL